MCVSLCLPLRKKEKVRSKLADSIAEWEDMGWMTQAQLAAQERPWQDPWQVPSPQPSSLCLALLSQLQGDASTRAGVCGGQQPLPAYSSPAPSTSAAGDSN